MRRVLTGVHGDTRPRIGNWFAAESKEMVAHKLGISVSMVNTYINQVRIKYAAAGGDKVGGMEYRQLGRSGLRVSVLAMGTMTFGGRGVFAKVGGTDLDDAKRQLDRALDAGVNLIDTSVSTV